MIAPGTFGVAAFRQIRGRSSHMATREKKKKEAVLGFDNSPEQVGDDANWSAWDIKMAGEFAP